MKRKIITNPNAPLAKENPQDFSELLSQYEAGTAPSSSGSGSGVKWFSAAAAVGIITLGLVYFFNADSNELAEVSDSSVVSESTEGEQSSFELPKWTQLVSGNEASTVVSPKGVIIEIPAFAFSTANGTNPDSVTIELTHYDDITSIIHSQIPMNYDSAGVEYHFQTDGMFQIQASAAGEAVHLNQELAIHYPQISGVEGMNTYAFTNGNWNYEGSAPITSYNDVCQKTIYKFDNQPHKEHPEEAEIKSQIASITQTNEALESEIESLAKSNPLEPKKQNFDNYRFTLDVNPEEFPELSHFEDVVFEVKDSRFTFNIYEETWNDVSVKKSPKEGRYLITLKNSKRLEIFDVYPVLSDSEYSAALETYSEKMREIELKKKDKRLKIRENKQRERDFLAKLETYSTLKKQKSQQQNVINALTADLKPDAPYRSITVGSLGIINFDTPLTIIKKGMAVAAAFFIKNTKIPVNAVSLIDTKKKAFYTYRKEDFNEFRVLKGRDYLIVSTLKDGKIAVYRSEFNHDKLSKTERNRFELELAPEFATLDELKEFLGISLVDA